VLRENLSEWVPDQATAVVLNVTVTQPQQAGYLTVYPVGEGKPNASNLNFSRGETVANLVVVPSNGVLDIANNSGGTVQVVADLEGYYSTFKDINIFVPYGPTREVDTRTVDRPLAPHATYTAPVLTDVPCIPNEFTVYQCVTGVVDNVTVTQPTRAGNLIVYPASQTRPLTSNLNFSPGETVPNLVMVGVTEQNRQVSFYNDSSGTVQLIIDEYGYFLPGSTP
jgi:hypothetical protein